MVSVGAVPPDGVASVNRLPQALFCPAVPPAELMHAEMLSASESISLLEA